MYLQSYSLRAICSKSMSTYMFKEFTNPNKFVVVLEMLDMLAISSLQNNYVKTFQDCFLRTIRLWVI